MRKYVYKDELVTFQKSVQVLEKAGKIDPRSTAVWLTLFSIYNTDLKDRENALRAKRAFLKALPTERRGKLAKWIKTMFAKYPS